MLNKEQIIMLTIINEENDFNKVLERELYGISLGLTEKVISLA